MRGDKDTEGIQFETKKLKKYFNYIYQIRMLMSNIENLDCSRFLEILFK